MITEEYFLVIGFLYEKIVNIHGVDFSKVYIDCANAYIKHQDNPYEFLKCFGKVTAEEIGIYMDIYDIFEKKGFEVILKSDDEDKAISLINKLIAIKKTRA